MTPDERRAEGARQNKAMDAIAQSNRVLIDEAIRTESYRMVAEFEATGNVAIDNGEHMQIMSDIFRRIATMSIEVMGAEVIAGGILAFRPITFDDGKSFQFSTGGTVTQIWETKVFSEFFARLVDEYVGLESIRERITSITRTTRNMVINQIQSGQAAGEGSEAIALRISKGVPRISRYRASTIARTETHAASGYGASQSAKTSQLPMLKEWISVHDHRTRDFQGENISEYDHRSMDGQIVREDQDFTMPRINGDALKIAYAGQAEAPAGAVINCRCTVAYFIDEGAAFG